MRRVSPHAIPRQSGEECFRQHMAAARRARRMSQDELAAAVGIISRSAVSEIETGKRGIGLDEAVLIAAALDVPLLDMLGPGLLFIRVPVQ